MELKDQGGHRRGVAMGVVFVVLMVLFLGGMALSHLMRGVQRQLEFSDAHVRCQYIGEAGMNLLLTRLLARPWKDRWFAGGPDSQSEIPYGGGTYDYFVSDTPGRTQSVDLWIRATFKTVKHCFFWRIKYDRGLLGGLAQGIPVNRLEVEEGDAPPPGTTVTTPFTEKIEQIIAERNAKSQKATEITKGLQDVVPTDRVLIDLGRDTRKPVQIDPFVKDVGPVPPPPPPPIARFPPLRLPPLPPLFVPAAKRLKARFVEWVNTHKPDPSELAEALKTLDQGFEEYKNLLTEKKVKAARRTLKNTMIKINRDFEEEDKEKEKNNEKRKPDDDDDDDD